VKNNKSDSVIRIRQGGPLVYPWPDSDSDSCFVESS